MKKIFLLVFILLISSNSKAIVFTDSSYAKKRFKESGFMLCNMFKINIMLELKDADVNQLKNEIDYINKNAQDAPCKNGKIVAYLSSSGGDIRAAIAMGRILRMNEIYAFVHNDSKCLSSCVFLFAGAVRRTVIFGKIGIHRPYFSDLNKNLSTIEIKKYREDLNNEIKKYFEEVDVSQTLLDAMLAVPPEDMRILSLGELNGYRLGFEDATFNEKVISMDAKKYGMTSADYRKREVIARYKCNTSKDFSVCWIATILEINEIEAKKRDNLKFQCFDEKTKKINEICERNVLTKGRLN